MENSNEKLVAFKHIPNISSLMCVLGLTFPPTATEFQMAALTLAHLMASVRDYVLKFHELPDGVLDTIDSLHYVMQSNCDNQTGQKDGGE